jgi:hypothetical protein
MASDAHVTAKIVLEALRDVERRGSTRAMQELEAAEPDLAEHVIDGLTEIHRRLSRYCDRPQQARTIYQFTRRVLLVSVMALRRAHYELWRERAEGTPLAELDADDNGGDVNDADDPDQPRNGGPPAELT